MRMPEISAILDTAWQWFRRAGARCIGHTLQLLFFLPIRKDRVLVAAFNGLGYCCNPKYISEYLAEHSEVELIWGFRHPKKYARVPNIKAVRYRSARWFYYSATAAVVLSNVGFSRMQPKRKGQLLIDSWHGGGAYKRVGSGSHLGQNRMSQRDLRQSVNKIDLFISSSEKFSEYAIRGDHGYEGEILPCGMPRNDLFFDAGRRNAAAHRARSALGLRGPVALYAPTFRGRISLGYRTDFSFPYERVLSALRARFGDEVTLLKRAHPGGIMVDGAHRSVVDVTDYPDMQELLCAADILITDYSSSIWDYALLGRPCLLYGPDLEEYTAERGLCTPVEEWPGIVCRSDAELEAAIRSFDARECAQRAERHLRALGSYETGTATEQVCERILRHVGCR